MTYALDTNIISYMLKDDDAVYERYYDTLAHGNLCVVPLMVYYEIRRGLMAFGSYGKLSSFEDLCAELGIDDLTVADMNAAADIYADRKRLGRLPGDTDILIAAQAISHGYVLVTNNVRHFEGIAGLQFVNWMEN